MEPNSSDRAGKSNLPESKLEPVVSNLSHNHDAENPHLDPAHHHATDGSEPDPGTGLSKTQSAHSHAHHNDEGKTEQSHHPPHPHTINQNNALANNSGHEHEEHPHPHPHPNTATQDYHAHLPADHGHDHGADHDQYHDQGQNHEHGHSKLGWLRELLPFGHGHSHGAAKVDAAMETNERGIWALKISLLILAVTAAFQVVIVLISGSVALLADTIHNFSDALTAIPLWIAFVLGRRAANRRYTYGYGRVEDLAGVVIVLIIFFSALVAGFESYQKILNPQPITNVGWVIVAAIVGFIGNEAVAILRIRVGREIGSAALVADGQHARVDGVTSLAVLFGALGVLAGYPLLDPIIGLLITVAILFIVKDSALTMWHRMMDAIEPEVLESVEYTAKSVPGVLGIEETRVRWLGHNLQAELNIKVDGNISTRQSHRLAEEVRHALYHAQPRLNSIVVHVNPDDEGSHEANHQITLHHVLPGKLAHH